MAAVLRDAPFLADPLVRHVLSLLSGGGDEARVIGGAVRNTLLGLPVADIDIATTVLPEAVIERVTGAGLKAVPTGIEHGTVTVIGQHHVVEVTTLREDIATDGRRAVVRFGRDWDVDAARRDFTINALSVDLDGIVHDPVGGVDDLAARRVRFIGSADQRIAEDRLRSLRFFRFHAAYGAGPLDAEGLGAAIRARHDLGELSAERIGQEMRKLVVARGAVETVTAMQESGILSVVSASVGDLAGFAALPSWEDGNIVPALRFATLFARVQEDVDRIALRFRLSNGERRRMTLALQAASVIPRGTSISDHVLLHKMGRDAFTDGLTVAAARKLVAAEEVLSRRVAAQAWTIPTFPLSGRDVVEIGIDRGPLVGLILRHLERGWIEEDFAPDADELRRRMQAMISAAIQQQQQ